MGEWENSRKIQRPGWPPELSTSLVCGCGWEWTSGERPVRIINGYLCSIYGGRNAESSGECSGKWAGIWDVLCMYGILYKYFARWYTYIHYLYTEYGIPDICTQYSNRALIDHGNLGSDFSLSFSTVKKKKKKDKMGHLMGLDVLSCTTIVPPRDPHEDRRNPLSRTLSPPGG